MSLFPRGGNALTAAVDHLFEHPYFRSKVVEVEAVTINSAELLAKMAALGWESNQWGDRAIRRRAA
jgi:hypothetical protein